MRKWQFLQIALLATVVAVVNSPTHSKADPRAFTAKDFNFYDPSLRKWASIIIEGVNKVAHENAECVKADPWATDFAGEDQVQAKNPVFSMDCEDASGRPFNVRFSADDARKQVTLSRVTPIQQSSATEACEKAVKARTDHPSTIDMSRFWDADFRTFPNGRTVFESTFSARNAYNLKLRFKVSCHFEGTQLSAVDIFEDAAR